LKSILNFRRSPYLAIIFCIFSAPQLIAQDQISVKSPDNKIKISFSLQKLSVYNYGGNSPDAPYYEVTYEESAIILPSRLGFIIGGEPELSSCFKVINHSIIHHESTWTPIYGERNSYPDNYNELTIRLEEYIPPHRQLDIRFRSYNEGIAIRYSFPSIKKMKF
jgi:alpha-glucosidase